MAQCIRMGVAIALVIAAAAVLLGTDDGVPMQAKILDKLARGIFAACGMYKGAGPHFIFPSWRECYETVHISSKAGTWDDVTSTDVVLPSGQPVRVFVPHVEAARQLPVMVYLHGGGFTIHHSTDRSYDLLARELAKDGQWIVVSPDYRLGPEHPFPAAVEDCYEALHWAASAAHPLLERADLSQLMVGGDSAGGNLAAVLSILNRNGKDAALKDGPRLDLAHQLLVYPATNPKEKSKSRLAMQDTYFISAGVMEWFASAYFGFDGEVEASAASDIRYSPASAETWAGLPPATLVHAQLDPLRDEGIVYAQMLRDAGVPAVEFDVKSQPHGFFAFPELQMEATFLAYKNVTAAINAALASREA